MLVAIDMFSTVVIGVAICLFRQQNTQVGCKENKSFASN